MSRPSTAPPGWHLAILSTLAISHPLAAVLVRGPEFFVAHDLGRSGLLLLAAGLFAGIPALVWAAATLARRVHAGAGRVVAMAAWVALSTLIAAQILKRVGIDSHLTLPLAGIAGLVSLGLYVRFAAARLFVSALAPAPLVSALVFFTATPVATLIRTLEPPAVETGAGHAPPVVMIVFDQLPLLSLLDEHRQIDRRRFPNFAALADVSTWYRNTTGAATLTNWALPALVTGRYPRADLLPAAVDHPGSLFSMLAATHRFHVVEPITALCPPRLCTAAGGTSWTALASDLAVVYGHIALPATLASGLPPVTHNWRGFGFDFWQRRWSERRDDDRRQTALDWIAEIDRGDQPALHFLHVLLPHEPYVYLPTGQMSRPGGEPLGIEEGGIWSSEPRIVALAYEQHLQQVQFVDRLLGLALDRLRQVGLFDDALVVVVADHGVAFRPGRPFKQPVDSTLAEIAAIPFLIKPPGTRTAHVDDAPRQAIDVLPTIAAAIGIPASWDVEGRAAQAPAAPDGGVRRIYRDRSQRYVTFTAEAFEQALRAGEQRKWDAVDPDASVAGWPGDPARHLIGVPLADVAVSGHAGLAAFIDIADAFSVVDPAGPLVPAFVTGVARSLDAASSVHVPLVLAVNGVIRATTQPGRRAVGGRRNVWAALVPPGAYRAGANEVELFEVLSTTPAALRPVWLEGRPEGPPNLLNEAVQAALGIREQGFHGTETTGSTTYRWTDGNAALTIPVDTSRPPSDLELRTYMASDGAATMAIRVNGCTLFEGPSTVPPTRRIALAPCGPFGDTVTVAFLSGTAVPGPDDTRQLGVALESVRLH